MRSRLHPILTDTSCLLPFSFSKKMLLERTLASIFVFCCFFTLWPALDSERNGQTLTVNRSTVWKKSKYCLLYFLFISPDLSNLARNVPVLTMMVSATTVPYPSLLFLLLLSCTVAPTTGLVPSFFRHEDLKTALSCYQLGNELAAKGQYRQAARKYREGIYVGRPVVQELTENHDMIHVTNHRNHDGGGGDDNDHDDHTARRNDDPSLALELLKHSYVASSDAHVQLGDLDTARKDAWAACLVTNNQDVDALECMLRCTLAADDRIGELCTLKLLLEETKAAKRRRQELDEQDKDGVGAATSFISSSSTTLDDEDMHIIQLCRRIAEVQRYLDNELAQRLEQKKRKDAGLD